jgi:Ca2+/Na+ antiporter
MKHILILLFLLFTFLSYSQSKDYQPAYELSKELNTQYKLKITSLDSVITKQDIHIQDLQSIIVVKSKVALQDSLHISFLDQQKQFLNQNIALYKKELANRDTFWNKPVFGFVVGITSTIVLIHIVNYTLPR